MEVEKDEEYWRKKLSYYLGFEVFQRVGESWRKMYENIIKAKKNPYKIIELDYAEILGGLIRHGFDPSDNENRPIVMASHFNALKSVKLLLKDPRVDPSANDNLPIERAVANNNLKIFKLLLANPRVNPNQIDKKVSYRGYRNVNPEIAKLLISHPTAKPYIYKSSDFLECADPELIRAVLRNPNIYNFLKHKTLEEMRKKIS